MPNRDCVSDRELRSYVAGDSSDCRAQIISAHLETCSECEAAAQQLDDLTHPMMASLQRALSVDSSRHLLLRPDKLAMQRETSHSREQEQPSPCTDDLNPTRLPTKVGGYELLEELGRGGMGIVYKARQTAADRVVALKMILGGRLASAAEVQRFSTEAAAAARLDHPNIIALHEVGEYDGRPFFTMKWIDGQSLAQNMPALRTDVWAAVGMLATVARAVHYAHQRGIIHRDLKPANILIDGQQRPHVSDFGLARPTAGGSSQTETGVIIGTPSYMAPEQASGKKEVTTSADLYSLGAILYELLTGRPPFKAETPLETVLQVREQNPEPPRAIDSKINRDLELICLKCLAKDPQARYGSAEALAIDLEHWLVGEPLNVRPPSVPSLMRFWLRHNFGSAGWIAVIGLAFGLFGGVIAWMRGGHMLFGASTADAFRQLPSVDPPWLMAVFWAIPSSMMVVLYFANLGLLGTAGLIVAGLVRPKNRGADIAAGAAVGFVYGATVLILSGGALLITVIALEPIQGDLLILAQAAWSEPTPREQVSPLENGMISGPIDQLLEKYPDLRQVPGDKRGQVFYEKIRGDLIAGFPLGIWLAALFLVPLSQLLFTVQVMAAGPLLRRQTGRSATLLAYLERAVPATVLISITPSFILAATLADRFSTKFNTDVPAQLISYLPMFALLALALTATLRGWNWPLRLVLHTAWVLGAGVPTVVWSL